VADMTGRGFLYLGISGRGVNRFLNPEQVWVSEEGTMFVADAGNNRVVRIYDFLGQGWEEIRGLSHPSGVALYGKKLFVADTGNDRVLVYSSMDSGAQVTYTDPRLIKPTRLWVDAQGQLYVACGEDPPGGRILVIPAEADPARSADWPCYEGQGLRPTGFGPSQAVTSGGPLFIIDASSARLVRVDNLQGRDPRELGGYGSGERRFERPAGLGVDTQGALYVADTGHDRVVKVDDISGRGWTVFDGSGDPQKTLRGPRSVFVWAPRPPRPSPSPSQSPSPSPRSNRFRDQ
jgi:DNA-binding beta-propeller fold protein YncE